MEQMLKGRPTSLAVLDYGLFKVHANGRVIGICGYLIETDAGERVLVDTGFPAAYATDGAAAAAADGLGSFGEVLALTVDNLPPAQLARLGLAPEDIDLLLMTHSHIDHVGGIADFPQALLVISAAERALPEPLYFGSRRPMVWPDRDTRLIDAEGEIGPGLTVLLTPGHTPGQISLLVELPETGPVLLTGDAISRPAELEERFEGTTEAAQALASAERLLALAEARGAMVIYGHCPQQWQTLRKAPERYL